MLPFVAYDEASGPLLPGMQDDNHPLHGRVADEVTCGSPAKVDETHLALVRAPPRARPSLGGESPGCGRRSLDGRE